MMHEMRGMPVDTPDPRITNSVGDVVSSDGIVCCCAVIELTLIVDDVLIFVDVRRNLQIV